MNALLIANGCVDDVQFYKEEVLGKIHYDMIICADGGVKNTLKLGLIPNIVIGDLDSIDDEIMEMMVKQNIKIIKYPKEKDETDTELVLDYLIEQGYIMVTMIGCLGNRMDHSLGNIYLLKKLLKNKVIGHIVDEKNYITLIDKQMELIDKKDSIISLIPLTDRVEGITTKGLYYSLDNALMLKEKPYGISNVIISKYAKVIVNSGELLILICKD